MIGVASVVLCLTRVTERARRTTGAQAPTRAAGVPWLQPVRRRGWWGPLVRTAGAFGARAGRPDTPSVALSPERFGAGTAVASRSAGRAGACCATSSCPPVASTRWAKAHAECQRCTAAAAAPRGLSVGGRVPDQGRDIGAAAIAMMIAMAAAGVALVSIEVMFFAAVAVLCGTGTIHLLSCLPARRS
jgi:hypothetical protein